MAAEQREARLPHEPVLYQEVIARLRPHSPGLYVDCTLGAGGHAAGILTASAPEGLLLGLDVDPQALALSERRLDEFGPRAILRCASYLTLQQQLRDLAWEAVDGVLLDLGASSMQFEQAERGFSFQLEGPLDMRFDPATPRSAADLVNELQERELADLIFEFGEERHSRRIAKAIAAARPLRTTTQLAEVIATAIGRRRGRLHPATRSFQALRIAVNAELESLRKVLPQAVEALKSGGRLAVIAFHSLEDRIVKQFLRSRSQQHSSDTDRPPTLRLLSRKPLQAGEVEIERNPRARSARLRVAEKL